MKWKNERGFTLVEILASLTILGIVFISFMTIFPQMANVNDHTQTKLQTMNVAKQELAKLKNMRYPIDINERIKPSTHDEQYETYVLSEDEYYIEMFCYDEKMQTCSGQGDYSNTNRKTELYKTHIKVIKDGKISSETFGYLKIE